MLTDTETRQAEPRETECCAEVRGSESPAAPTCPMAAMCRGFLCRLRSAYWLLVPAAVLILVGVAIIVEPRLLVWLLGVVLILLGVAVAFCAHAVSKAADRFREHRA